MACGAGCAKDSASDSSHNCACHRSRCHSPKSITCDDRPFEVKQKEPLRLLLNVTKAPDFGQYQVSVNGVKLGAPMDGYNAKVVNEEFHLLDFWPEPGAYTLRLECVGKNHLSSGCYLGLESVRLRERRPRVLQYGFEQDSDWRKHPKLYN